MLFSSFTFISVFLPLVCAFYFLLRRWKNIVLLAASLVFYAWGEPRYLPVILSTVLLAWIGGILLTKTSWRKTVLGLAVALQICCLFYFKYVDFFLLNLNVFFGTGFNLLKLALPIGVSFYSFKAVSYLTDVFRKEANPRKNILDVALYLMLFPQVLAGPITRYKDLDAQITDRHETMEDVSYGIRRFIIGLGKKMFIGNAMGMVADKVFALPVTEFDTVTAWIGAVAYMMQIYYDFSGYSDMAIGLCRIFGFKVPENFNYPYISASISEFWRRWHISLGDWFKHYLYIPLGGNRVSKIRNAFNLFFVFLMTGIWHGANWTFIVWGVFNGVLVVFEKLCFKTEGKRLFKHLYALLAILLGWVVFRSDNLSYAGDYIRRMFGLYGPVDRYAEYSYFVDNFEIMMFALACLFSMPVVRNLLPEKKGETGFILDVGLLILFVASIFAIAASTYNPFIYFKF